MAKGDIDLDLDAELVGEAETLGLDTSAIVEQALAQAVQRAEDEKQTDTK